MSQKGESTPKGKSEAGDRNKKRSLKERSPQEVEMEEKKKKMESNKQREKVEKKEKIGKGETVSSENEDSSEEEVTREAGSDISTCRKIARNVMDGVKEMKKENEKFKEKQGRWWENRMRDVHRILTERNEEWKREAQNEQEKWTSKLDRLEEKARKWKERCEKWEELAKKQEEWEVRLSEVEKWKEEFEGRAVEAEKETSATMELRAEASRIDTEERKEEMRKLKRFE